ncbi:hypothetical protein V5799_000392 [Amblyomma americanum]|uniref:non-specific serine/threonine protein kinase n=1 Tax=Amblyomma americanum TaxID=6943 RepID=A0AAQ4D360_AMBAM
MSMEEKEGSLTEAKVLAMLHHPNIVAYYDSFLDEKSLAIVMEYAPVIKIIRGEYAPVPTHYSVELRRLLERLLQKEPSMRPSVNQILAQPILLHIICNLYLTVGSLPCVAQ